MLCIFMYPFYILYLVYSVDAFTSLYGTPWAYYCGESVRYKCPDYYYYYETNYYNGGIFSHKNLIRNFIILKILMSAMRLYITFYSFSYICLFFFLLISFTLSYYVYSFSLFTAPAWVGLCRVVG